MVESRCGLLCSECSFREARHVYAIFCYMSACYLYLLQPGALLSGCHYPRPEAGEKVLSYILRHLYSNAGGYKPARGIFL